MISHNNKNPIRIALVDDHDTFREGVLRILSDFGFETVFGADSGKSALDEMEACDLIPDVCIVDVSMSVMNGFETTKALCQKYPQLKILALSLNDNEKDVIKMLESGANGYLLKKTDPQELRKAIQIVYHGGQYFSAGIREKLMPLYHRE